MTLFIAVGAIALLTLNTVSLAFVLIVFAFAIVIAIYALGANSYFCYRVSLPRFLSFLPAFL